MSITLHGRKFSFSSGYSQTYNVGSGSGNLTIDNSGSTYIDNSLILIAPGTYGTITIRNFNPATLITIKNGTTGQVVTTNMNYSNYSNLLVSGNGSSDAYGFYIANNPSRPTTISGYNRNSTIQYANYFNIGDYPIYCSNGGVTWDNTDATVFNINCRFLHNKFDTCPGVIQLGGNCTLSAVTDLSRGTEFGYNTWVNCDAGDLVFGGATDQYLIHDNDCSNINLTNNNDNGLFHIIGNGNFYRNYVHGHQGHAIRIWSLSFGATPRTCLVYDNIVIGSRKYSAFEWQSTVGANIVAAPNTTYCNIRLNNNTAGDLNLEHHTEFDACLIENYGMPAGSTQEVYNNLLYNTFSGNTGTANRFMQFDGGGSLQTQLLTQGNIYAATFTAAGFDETALTLTAGPAKNAGVSGHLIDPNDYHNLAFNNSTPSIGAVQ